MGKSEINLFGQDKAGGETFDRELIVLIILNERVKL